MQKDLNSVLKPRLQQLQAQDYEQFDEYDVRSRRVDPFHVCYFVDHKSIVPLKSVEYDVLVQNCLAVVNITQTYENALDKPAHIEYLFSISPTDVFTKLEVHIGDKILYGQIKEKQQAKTEYEEGIKQGKTMVFSEKDTIFPDVMRVKLGNLEPNQILQIVFEYIQPLEVCVNEFWRLTIDPAVHPRYRLTKDNDMVKKLNSVVHIQNYNPKTHQNIQINIQTTSPLTLCKSPTHEIIVKQAAQTQIILNPKQKSNFQSDKTFVLIFANQDIHKPQLYLTHTNNDSLQYQKYCLTLTLIPQFNQLQLDDAYQAYLSQGNLEQNQFTYPEKGSYLFLLDRSGSMGGIRMEKAKKALIEFLKGIPKDSYFNIISFGNQSQLLFPQPVRHSSKKIHEAIEAVQVMQADLGGTEILEPLEKYIYKLIPQEGYPQNIFILTDGEVTPDPVIELVRKNCNSSNRVYTLGIGSGCSKYLVEKVAHVGNGKFHFAADKEDISKKLIDLLQDSITPFLEQIRFSTSIKDYHCITPNPDSLVCLRKNTPVRILMLFGQGSLMDETPIIVNFSSLDPQISQQLTYSNQITLKDSVESDHFHKLAAYSQITIIEDSFKYRETHINELLWDSQEVTLKDLIDLSITNQVLSKTTAFICEVKEMADQFKQQSQDIQLNQVNRYKPNLIPQMIQQSINAPQFKGGSSVSCVDSVIMTRNDQQLRVQNNKQSKIGQSRERSVDRKVQKKQTKQSPQDNFKSSILQQIIDSSNAFGGFQITIRKIFNPLVPNNLPADIWLCLIILCYLETYQKEQQYLWQRVYDIQIQYLMINQVIYERYRETARAILNGTRLIK